MKRIATALVLIPATVWVILFAPSWAFLAFAAAVGLIAFYEFDQIAAAQSIPSAGWPGMLAGVALLLSPEPFAIVVIASLLAMTLALRQPDLTRALAAAAAFLLGVVYIFGAWRCAAELRTIAGPSGPHWLMLSLLVSWAGDTAAMYVGRAFGKSKLAPRVSPGKTWVGAIASVAGGTIAAGVYAHFLIPDAPLAETLAIGAAANIAGQFGDLCESAFKRGANVKDSGTTLPGHGGWLDRIDSSLFSVPVVYAIVKFVLR
jgi:phosphatidate cytidylyltransferase